MYFLRRILFIPPLLLLITFLAFVLVRIAPGGPFDRERTPASPEVERRLKARYHLDEPLWKQYLRYVGKVVQGDLGPSLKQRNHTVNEIVKQGLPISLMLGGCAFMFAMGIGIPLGLFRAARANSAFGHAALLAAALAVAVPALVIGPLLAMIFAVKLGWFPVALLESPAHFVLPTVTLGLYFAGRVARLMDEGLRSISSSNFLLTARAKGLSDLSILFRHALPLAILPVVSYSGPMLADLLTGSFVVENIFQIPGIGVFMVNSSLSRDYTLTVGLVLIYATLLLFLNLLVDIAYGVLDPRVRLD